MQSTQPDRRFGSAAVLIEGYFLDWSAALHRRSRTLVAVLDVRLETAISAWIGVVVLLGLAKLVTAPMPVHGLTAGLLAMLPYLLIAAAPVAGYRVAAGSFPRGLLSAQPLVRLCRYGAWQQVDPVSARQNPAFGPTGFMASLLAGILLNVPFRSVEFILALPAVGPGAPGWAQSLNIAMTIDVVVMNFLYMVCFVMALRSVPLFPRMLLFAWTADILLQFAIASQIGGSAELPVPVGAALQNLLHGNIQKVLISAFVWLPYLILSDRVNITFRQRVRA